MTVDLVSIAMPTYEMHGKGAEFLNFALTGIYHQTYKNIEVVISDHSLNDDVKNVCDTWSKKGLTVKYLKNEEMRGSSSANINNALKASSGKYIKILFQDDFLYCADAIEKTVASLKKEPNKKWLVSACEHSNDGIHVYRPFFPRYHNQIHLGNNTISSPSVLTLVNQDIIYFDFNLIWLMDVEYYKRLYIKFGAPIIVNDVTIVNRTWEKQISSIVSDELKLKEKIYVTRLYENVI